MVTGESRNDMPLLARRHVTMQRLPAKQAEHALQVAPHLELLVPLVAEVAQLGEEVAGAVAASQVLQS